jgi:hypothetical protein
MDRRNPYNFVSLPAAGPERGPYPGLDRLGDEAYSGVLVCDLEAVTRLFTAGQQQAKPWPGATREQRIFPFLKNSNGDPILQATSLKGMIRSVFEAAFPSCLPLVATAGVSQKGGTNVPFSLTLPAGYDHESCNGLENLCPACRLFGIAQGQDVHAQGRVLFSDAVLTVGELQQEEVKLSELSSPKPASAIYSKGGEIRGRKFYYHHDPALQPGVDQLGDRSNAISEHAPPKTVFRFTLRFENLTRTELSRLIACLTLDEKHAHKLGLAKPLGYGSCKISLCKDGSSVAKGGSRYQSWNAKAEPFEESQWRIEEGWPPAELERLLRVEREGVTQTGYPPLKEYKDLDIDEDGLFFTTTAPTRQRAAAPPPSRLDPSGPPKSLFEMIDLVAEPVKAPTPPPKDRKKATLEVVRHEAGQFILRDPETGQEEIACKDRGYGWQVGGTYKVRIVKTAKDGRILEIKPA